MQQSATRRHWGYSRIAALAVMLLAALGAMLFTPTPAHAAIFTVTNTNDSGLNSFRQAIIDANNTPGADSIIFNIPGNGPHVLTPATPYPAITGPVVIDAEGEALWAGATATTPANLRVELNGSVAGGTGLVFTAGAAGSTVRGLVINRFTTGIEIQGNNITIRGSIIGLNQAGTSDAGTMQVGVYINNASNNTIGGTVSSARNVISGNDNYGIRIEGGSATNNRIYGNYIGLAGNGTTVIGNGNTTTAGVYILNAGENFIGAASTAGRNVISGNPGAGVLISGALSGGNVLEGNYIGLDRTGTVAAPNGTGIIVNNAADTRIGGAGAARNVISGNTGDGVSISGANATTILQSNYIGTNAAGTGAVGNGDDGIDIVSAANSVIGGSGVGNVISANASNGIRVSGATAVNLIIQSNLIGTDITGSLNLGNVLNGVAVYGIDGMTLGGTTANAGNVISGSGEAGVLLTDGASNVAIQGNFIGTNAAGGTAIPNNVGVQIDIEGSNNVIGGTTVSARNIISGNNAQGVFINGGGENFVQGNYIGVNAGGGSALGNGVGVHISNGPGNVIGGTAAGSRNVISGNHGNGVVIDYDPEIAGSVGDNRVEGNYIGTSANGLNDVGNGGNGVQVGQPNTIIGGTTVAARNVISGNNENGIYLVYIGDIPSSNRIQGNYIGVDANGGGSIGNSQNGILIDNINNQIGGSAAGAGNWIANNLLAGVTFFSTANRNGSSIRGNSIFNNGGLGIDLPPDGITPNDPNDADGGPNDTQNFPELFTATSAGANYFITGQLESVPSTTGFIIDFYANETCPAVGGETEGQVYLGSTTVNTNANGLATFTDVVVSNAIGARWITATATTSTGSTSEFSACIKANNRPTITEINDVITEINNPVIVNFTVGDDETPVDNLAVNWEVFDNPDDSGDDPTVLTGPGGDFSLGGGAPNYSLTITPATDRNGYAYVRVTVTDADGGNIAEIFKVTVSTPPVISAIDDKSGGSGQPIVIPFTVDDAETNPNDLILSATSSEPSLIPVSNIVFGGSGTNRTVTITSVANQTGTSLITITVSDGFLSSSESFTVTISGPPSITDIPNQIIPANGQTAALPFTIGDDLTPVSELIVTATSSNQVLVPNNPANIVLSGDGDARTIRIIPVTGQIGTTTITVTVTDADGGTATDTFTVLVNAQPTISDIPDQSTPRNTPITVNVTIGDAETAASNLIISATSSNQSIVPNGNISYGPGGTPGAARTITLVPANNAVGTTTITVTVMDENGGTATDTFVLTVSSAPTISPIADQVTLVNTPTGAIPFTIGDGETPAANLVVTASSSNQTLVSDDDIFIGGSGANRAVTIFPNAGQSGETVISITVTDSSNLSTTETFVLRVNIPPSISSIPNTSTPVNTPTGAIAFTIGDDTTDVNTMNVVGSSSNQAVVANSGIAFSGSGANRSVVITPLNNAVGTTVITLSVTDKDGATTSISFDLNVFPGNTHLLTINGNFSQSTNNIPNNWGPFSPDGGIVYRTINGVFEFYRQSNSSQAVILQNTGAPLPLGAAVVARFDLGNSSNLRKRITVIMHDADFSDLQFCTFWLEPNTPLRTYRMRSVTTKSWIEAHIAFYAATGDSAGYYRIDNVEMYHVENFDVTDTTCFDPTTPATGAGAASSNLLGNGDFSANITPGVETNNNWSIFASPTGNDIIWRQTDPPNRVFEFYRPTTSTSAVVLQPSGDDIVQYATVEARFELGNSSGERKRIVVIVRNQAFTDLQACAFWLLPGSGMSTFVMRTYAPTNWTNASISFYVAGADNQGWARIDNVSMRTLGNVSVSGTECYLPSAGVSGEMSAAEAAGVVDPALIPALLPTATPGAAYVPPGVPSEMPIAPAPTSVPEGGSADEGSIGE